MVGVDGHAVSGGIGTETLGTVSADAVAVKISQPDTVAAAAPPTTTRTRDSSRGRRRVSIVPVVSTVRRTFRKSCRGIFVDGATCSVEHAQFAGRRRDEAARRTG